MNVIETWTSNLFAYQILVTFVESAPHSSLSEWLAYNISKLPLFHTSSGNIYIYNWMQVLTTIQQKTGTNSHCRKQREFGISTSLDPHLHGCAWKYFRSTWSPGVILSLLHVKYVKSVWLFEPMNISPNHSNLVYMICINKRQLTTFCNFAVEFAIIWSVILLLLWNVHKSTFSLWLLRH